MSQLNTVTISTDEFLALKKFETAFMLLDENKKQVIKVEEHYGFCKGRYFVLDESAAFLEMKKIHLINENRRNEAQEKWSYFKNMSIWQFIKFKMGW